MIHNAKYYRKKIRNEKDESRTRPLQAFSFVAMTATASSWGEAVDHSEGESLHE